MLTKGFSPVNAIQVHKSAWQPGLACQQHTTNLPFAELWVEPHFSNLGGRVSTMCWLPP